MNQPTRTIEFAVKVTVPLSDYEAHMQRLLTKLSASLYWTNTPEERADVYDTFFGEVTTPFAEDVDNAYNEQDEAALTLRVRVRERDQLARVDVALER